MYESSKPINYLLRMSISIKMIHKACLNLITNTFISLQTMNIYYPAGFIIILDNNRIYADYLNLNLKNLLLS